MQFCDISYTQSRGSEGDMGLEWIVQNHLDRGV